MERSPSIANLAKALKEFHKLMNNIPKDATNPFFNSKYVQLSTILEAIKEPLQQTDLTFTQFPTGQNGLTTLLMHTESGEFMQADYFIQPIKNDPQAQGSVITYMRRYALASVLGLNFDEDKGAPQYNSGAAAPAKTYKKELPKKEDGTVNWLNPNTTDWHEVTEHLKNGIIDLETVKETFALNKTVQAELEDIIRSRNEPPKVAANNSAIEKPWLDKNSKKWDLIVERLRNKTTTLSQVAQFFKLNKEVRAELQAIVNEAGSGTAMDDAQ